MFIFSLLICSIAVLAQDQIKIEGKVYLTKIVSASECEVVYLLTKADGKSTKRETIKSDFVDKVYVADAKRRDNLTMDCEYLKAKFADAPMVAISSNPADTTAIKTLSQMISNDLSTWDEHLVKAGKCYNSAIVFGSLAAVSSIVPLFMTKSDNYTSIATGAAVASGVFTFTSLIFYITGNNHLIQSGELARSKKLSLNITPTGVGLALKL